MHAFTCEASINWVKFRKYPFNPFFHAHFFVLPSAKEPFKIPAVKPNSLQRRSTSFSALAR
tara:strand:- start:441 stop:623 length:183 start_codon:yes stop_codon:yes gene_type:complete